MCVLGNFFGNRLESSISKCNSTRMCFILSYLDERLGCLTPMHLGK